MKTGQGVVSALHVHNLDGSDTYLQVYDALTANVTVGTTTPTLTLWIPASSGVDSWTAVTDDYASGLFQFAAGLIVAATTTIGGSTDPTTGLLLNLVYT